VQEEGGKKMMQKKERERKRERKEVISERASLGRLPFALVRLKSLSKASEQALVADNLAC
jgi:hypothetical protein